MDFCDFSLARSAPISAARKNDPVMQIRSFAVADRRAAFQAAAGSSKTGQRRPVNSSATCCNSSGGTARELFE